MSSLRLGVLSDLHRTTNGAETGWWHNEYDFVGHREHVDRALGWFETEAVDALVLCGDLTHSSDPDAMDMVLRECLSGLATPVIAVSGNHDVADGRDMLAEAIDTLGDPRLVLATESGESVAGTRLAGVHVLPTQGYMRSSVRTGLETGSWGTEPVVVISHLPLLSRASVVASHGLAYPGDLVDREQVVAPLLSRDAPTIVVSGHLHVRDAYAEGTVLQLLQAAMIEPPFEAAVVSIEAGSGGGVVVSRRAVRTGGVQAAHEPTLARPSGSWRFIGGSWHVAPSPEVPDPLQNEESIAGCR